MYLRCSGAHSKSVTAVLPLASEAPGGPDMLLTAGADGSVAVWDPSRSATKGPDREIAPKHSFKAHDSAVHVSAPAAAGAPSCGALERACCPSLCRSPFCALLAADKDDGPGDRAVARQSATKVLPPATPQAMTYFLTYTEKPDPPVLRLATAGAFQLSAGVGGWAQQRAEAFGPPLQPEAAL
jgi:hypothetical protein